MITKLELIEYLKHTPENTNYNILRSGLYNGSNKEAVDEFIEALSRGNLSLAALQPYLAKLYEDDKTISPEPLPPFSSGDSSVPKPLTYDYMPEGYPTKTLGTATLMEEQELAFALEDEAVYSAYPNEAPEIVEGQTYTVNWDGTEYECVCAVFTSTILSLGNKSIYGSGNDTGEPFLYIRNQAVGAFATLETTASHTISVKRIDETVIPIDEKYLPESVFTDADWDFILNRPFFNKPLNVNITAENITETVNVGSNYVDLGAIVPDFNEGLYYKVEGEISFLSTSSGINYPLQINGYYKANSQAEISLGTVYDSSYRSNLEVSLYGNNNMAYRGKLCLNVFGNSAPYTITAAFTIISEVKMLLEDYIPNTIQRVGDDIIIPSSTPDSTKQFKITVDDSGTISATEIV